MATTSHALSARVRWLALVVFAGQLSACGGASTRDGNADGQANGKQGLASTSLGTIKRVEIVPPVIHAATGAKVRLEAIGRSNRNLPVPGPHAVTWSGSAAFEGTTDNPTLVHSTTVGDHPIAVQMAGISQSAHLIVSAPSTGTADQITLAHTNNNPVSVVLLDAQDASTSGCYTDTTLGIAGLAKLGVNLTAGCGNTLAVLAAGRAPRYECQMGSRPGCKSDPASRWTTSFDDVTLGALSNPLTVDVVLWYRVSLPLAQASQAAAHDLEYANAVFSSQRAGMRFNRAMESEDGRVLNFVASTGADPCAGADAELGLTPVAGALNIVYVEQIHIGTATDVRGLMCDRTDGAPRLIMLSRTEMAPSTPAHELAHVMGLMDRAFTGLGHHTTDLDGFNPTNLMWAAEDAGFGLERDHLTIGQVVRITVDERSWVNVERSGVAGLGRIRQGDTELCQGSRNTSVPCPVLRKELGSP